MYPLNTFNFTVLVEELDNKGNKLYEIGVLDHEFDNDREFYITKLSKGITKGNQYRISIDFVSALGDNLKGFYRSSFKNEDGEKRYYMNIKLQSFLP